jgi:hypothetical protein
MGDVPDKAGYEMALGARHRFSALGRAFRHQKALLRAYIDPYYHLHQEINRLRRSDPAFLSAQ